MPGHYVIVGNDWWERTKSNHFFKMSKSITRQASAIQASTESDTEAREKSLRNVLIGIQQEIIMMRKEHIEDKEREI